MDTTNYSRKKTIHIYVLLQNGFSTIEILIAFAVGIMFLSASIMLSFSDATFTKTLSLDSGQAAALDMHLDSNGLSRAQSNLGSVIATLRTNWNGMSAPSLIDSYQHTPTIKDVTGCIKEITDATTWNTLHSRSRSITLSTALGDISTVKALGGDCDAFSPQGTWNTPSVLSGHTFVGSKPLSIDVLHRIAYITDTTGTIQIFDTTNDILGASGDFTIVPYTDIGNIQLNDIDVVEWKNPSTGVLKRYAYVVRHDTTNQFQVIDVTTPGTYIPSGTKTLTGNNPPSGSFPQGWRVFYYDNYVYVTARETTGYEFHTFNVTTPLSPVEVGPGYEVNGTVNDLVITKVTSNGIVYKIAYLATSRSSKEVMILNVTNPSVAPVLLTTIDLGTTNNALSIQLIGTTLYVGRQKTAGGPELLVYKVTYGQNGSSPTVAVNQIGVGAEINTSVSSLRIAGTFAFIAHTSVNELSIWDVGNPSITIPRVDTTALNVSNTVFGLDYEAPYLYLLSHANKALQILYSVP